MTLWQICHPFVTFIHLYDFVCLRFMLRCCQIVVYFDQNKLLCYGYIYIYIIVCFVCVSVCQCSMTGVTKAVVCVILSVG